MVCFIFYVGVNVAIIVCFFSLHDVNKPAYRGKEPPDGKLPPPPLTQSPPFHLTPPPHPTLLPMPFIWKRMIMANFKGVYPHHYFYKRLHVGGENIHRW